MPIITSHLVNFTSPNCYNSSVVVLKGEFLIWFYVFLTFLGNIKNSFCSNELDVFDQVLHQLFSSFYQFSRKNSVRWFNFIWGRMVLCPFSDSWHLAYGLFVWYFFISQFCEKHLNITWLNLLCYFQ